MNNQSPAHTKASFLLARALIVRMAELFTKFSQFFVGKVLTKIKVSTIVRT
ncbi:hypothetical protein [Novisyntrophococcus fermenticellae]|uniref:hypothetical protein n=1 Tax=Novisyntrophococcus fermenticellae TaxID=2068655 RepID=UPI001E5CEA9A|nr:hypothetical protein [Novisyntrophococcus fermenticellae]